MLAGMAMMTMAFVGCTEDDSMSHYMQDKASGSSGRNTDIDDVISALETIPEVHNVKTEYDEDNEALYYTFYFKQPVDHYHPEQGTYSQYCQLKFKGWDNNVVVYTHGYNLSTRDVDLATLMDANQLNIEHRYFGNSLPEPFENTNMTYLNADQQSRDIHNIAKALKTLFKTGHWVTTGTSKDGITSALQAYYSDLNGWQDFDAHVPFCAPFLTGTTYSDGTFSCNDISIGTYLKDVCGSGYEAGTAEAIACERLRHIPWLVCTNKTVRDMAITACYTSSPESYARIVEQFNNHSTFSTGDLTKDLTAFAIQTYYWALYDKFAYVPYTLWAKIVPDTTPLENGTATGDEWSFFMSFFTMKDKDLTNYLKSISLLESNVAQGATRSVTEEMWEFLIFRRADESAPYYIQAFTELGSMDLDYSIVNNSGYLTDADCAKVNYIFTNQHSYEEAGAQGIYKQDRGQLMKNFRSWAETETTQPIIFVYAYNDPWTGGSIGDAVKNNPMIEKVIDYTSTHADYILNRNSYQKESEQAITSALNKFLQ